MRRRTGVDIGIRREFAALDWREPPKPYPDCSPSTNHLWIRTSLFRERMTPPVMQPNVSWKGSSKKDILIDG